MIKALIYEKGYAMQSLTPYQVELVRTYFYAIARLNGQECNEIVKDDRLLSSCVGTLCLIELDGGGNPILAAEKAMKKMTLTGRFGRAAKAFPSYWLDPERTWH